MTHTSTAPLAPRLIRTDSAQLPTCHSPLSSILRQFLLLYPTHSIRIRALYHFQLRVLRIMGVDIGLMWGNAYGGLSTRIATVSLALFPSRLMLPMEGARDTCIDLIVQPYRFQIVEDVGCYPSTYKSPLAYALYYMWSIAMGSVALFYGYLVLRQYHPRRADMSKLMPMKTIDSDSRSTTESLTFSRYMLLTVIHIICTIPVGIYSIYISATQVPIRVTAREPKCDWTKVYYIPSLAWRSDTIKYAVAGCQFSMASHPPGHLGSRLRQGGGTSCGGRGQ
ncbi:pheromone receptor [Moniliophthora roreri]|nr:pheromone receptor [Moniliophthora roreri]